MLIQKDIIDTRIEYSGGNVLYLGKSTIHKASTSEGELWDIYKYTWDGEECTRIEGPLRGNWDDRATISWSA